MIATSCSAVVGGMLGAEHAIRQPAGLKALVISNSPASMALWVSEAKILRGQLDPEVEAALDRHEADGTTDDAEYLAAQQVYYDLHVCRVVPNPPEVLRTTELLDEDPTVLQRHDGPNEFFCIGTLRNWSVVDDVHKITAPTLLASADSTRRRRHRAAVLRQHSGRALGDLRKLEPHALRRRTRTLPRRRRRFPGEL